MKNKLVANGFDRWLIAHDAKSRETIRAEFAAESEPQRLFGKARIWFRTEWECLRRQKYGEKSSPKILW
jgi:hypothetical protein